MKTSLPGASRTGRTIVFILLGLVLGGFIGEILAVGSAHLGEGDPAPFAPYSA